jgi:hypothetical protein
VQSWRSFERDTYYDDLIAYMFQTSFGYHGPWLGAGLYNLIDNPGNHLQEDVDLPLQELLNAALSVIEATVGTGLHLGVFDWIGLGLKPAYFLPARAC